MLERVERVERARTVISRRHSPFCHRQKGSQAPPVHTFRSQLAQEISSAASETQRCDSQPDWQCNARAREEKGRRASKHDAAAGGVEAEEERTRPRRSGGLEVIKTTRDR